MGGERERILTTKACKVCFEGEVGEGLRALEKKTVKTRQLGKKRGLEIIK